MRARRWQAWTILVAFTTASVACGGSNEATSAPAAAPPTQQVAQATPEPPPPPTPPPPAEPAPSPTLPGQPPEQLSKDELRELVAPVALYPDVVLGSLLPATTFPNQLHDAAVYVGNSQQVERVPDGVEWDGSIVGLLQFPDVLRWLDENPAWTDQMGQAVTYQQGDVLDAIQDYRRLVQKAGNLKSNQYQTVRAVRNDDIRIEPARPEIVYVPSYDPVVATQPQPVVATPGISPWLVFGGGAVVGALGAWALYSIFDDDDDVEIHNYYGRGGGGGWRRIRRYDNYYYARGRRPRRADWVPPRDRPYRHARAESWNRPRRLEHRPVDAGRPARAAALRAPTKPAQKPAQVRRQEQRMQRQENQAQKQRRQQEQRSQNQERKQEQRRQQQERQQGQQRQRQQRQQERRDDRQQQQQQRQQQQQQRREKQQEQERQRRENRQMQQQQRRENRAQQQEQRQQKQAERRQNQQERRQQNDQQNKKKQKQNQNQNQ